MIGTGRKVAHRLGLGFRGRLRLESATIEGVTVGTTGGGMIGEEMTGGEMTGEMTEAMSLAKAGSVDSAARGAGQPILNPALQMMSRLCGNPGDANMEECSFSKCRLRF